MLWLDQIEEHKRHSTAVRYPHPSVACIHMVVTRFKVGSKHVIWSNIYIAVLRSSYLMQQLANKLNITDDTKAAFPRADL